MSLNNIVTYCFEKDSCSSNIYSKHHFYVLIQVVHTSKAPSLGHINSILMISAFNIFIIYIFTEKKSLCHEYIEKFFLKRYTPKKEKKMNDYRNKMCFG